MKKQLYSNTIPAAEEEDESETVKIEEEDLFSEFLPSFFTDFNFTEIFWPEELLMLSTNIISIHTPPPEL